MKLETGYSPDLGLRSCVLPVEFIAATGNGKDRRLTKLTNGNSSDNPPDVMLILSQLIDSHKILLVSPIWKMWRLGIGCAVLAAFSPALGTASRCLVRKFGACIFGSVDMARPGG